MKSHSSNRLSSWIKNIYRKRNF